MVYPYLIYSKIIWGKTYKTRIYKIIITQKKIVQLMTYKSHLEHTEPIFKDLDILNDFSTAMFMFRYRQLKNCLKNLIISLLLVIKDFYRKHPTIL